MRSSRAASLGLVVAVLCFVPATAFAQLTPMFTAFGGHGPNSNLVTQPIGLSECQSDSITLTFSPVTASSSMRYIDVWWANSSTVTCANGMTRASTVTPVCHSVNGTFSYVAVNMSATVTIPISALYDNTCTTSETRTFFFFDVSSAPDNSSTFTSYWTLTAQLNATPPTAPVISGTVAGDQVLQIPWNSASFTALGTMGQVYVFADPSGCAGQPLDGGGTTTSTLSAGGTAPSTHLYATSATSPINLDTSLLGWSTGSYGQQASLAIAVVDSASNVSPLSNVICVQHVHVSGFWDEYCTMHGMTDTTACAANYRGCSVGIPSRRFDATACALGLIVAGLFVVRRRKR